MTAALFFPENIPLMVDFQQPHEHQMCEIHLERKEAMMFVCLLALINWLVFPLQARFWAKQTFRKSFQRSIRASLDVWCHVVGADIILEEATPIRIEKFHHRMKAASQTKRLIRLLSDVTENQVPYQWEVMKLNPNDVIICAWEPRDQNLLCSLSRKDGILSLTCQSKWLAN